MSDNELYDCGVDLNSDMVFIDGDINLSSYEANLVQAVVNRLNTQVDELDTFYNDYGSVLTGFFGWRATADTLQYIKTEVSNVLNKEPRLYKHEVNVSYDGNGVIHINLILYPNSNTNINVNLVLTVDGVITFEENVNKMLEV